MSVLQGSPRVEITISVNPEFELRLDRLCIQKQEPTAADFQGNRLEIGHAKFYIFSETGEINTGALLFVEYTGGRPQQQLRGGWWSSPDRRSSRWLSRWRSWWWPKAKRRSGSGRRLAGDSDWSSS
jgi:hypothetical protein